MLQNTLRFLTIALTCALLYSYNTNFSIASESQRAYDAWLKHLGNGNKTAESSSNIQFPFQMELQYPGDSASFRLTFESSDQLKDTKDSVIRLLELASTAKLFTPNGSKDDHSKYHLFLQSGRSKFHAIISIERLQSDIRVQNFFRLFRVYSKDFGIGKKKKALAKIEQTDQGG